MQPIKLEAKFPTIPNKQPDEKFKLVLTDIATDETLFDVLLEEKTIYRKNLELPYSTKTLTQTRFISCASGCGPTGIILTLSPRRCTWSTRQMRTSTH